MDEVKLAEGLTVIVEVPVPVTNDPVTSMVSTVEPSDDFLITILPLSTSTASLKVRTILAPTATPVAPSAGVEEDRVGSIISATVKFSVVLSEMPA